MESTTRSKILFFAVWSLPCAGAWTADSSQAQTTEQHLANLESALDLQVVATSTGHHNAKAWDRLEEHLLLTRASLEYRDVEAAGHLEELLRHLRRLRPRIENPEILERLHRAWRRSRTSPMATSRSPSCRQAPTTFGHGSGLSKRAFRRWGRISLP